MTTESGVKNKNEFLSECIDLYRELPALWQIKNKIYHDRDRKNKAYDLLLEKYREMFPLATKVDVKKKLNSLRTNYRKELKKTISSMKSGASADATYVSSLWYYDKLNFLSDQELPLDSVSSIDTPDADEDNEERSENQDEDLIQSEQQHQHHPTSSKNVNKKANKSEQILNLVYERLSERKDEFHYWAMACAADLRKMEKTQLLYAKKAIAEIIMEGQLGLLHRHSVKVNENAPSNSAIRFSASPSPVPSPSSHINHQIQFSASSSPVPSSSPSSSCSRPTPPPPAYVQYTTMQTSQPSMQILTENLNQIPSQDVFSELAHYISSFKDT